MLNHSERDKVIIGNKRKGVPPRARPGLQDSTEMRGCLVHVRPLPQSSGWVIHGTRCGLHATPPHFQRLRSEGEGTEHHQDSSEGGTWSRTSVTVRPTVLSRPEIEGIQGALRPAFCSFGHVPPRTAGAHLASMQFTSPSIRVPAPPQTSRCGMSEAHWDTSATVTKPMRV